MLTTPIPRQPSDQDIEDRNSLDERHAAYVDALRRHAGLLRDLDQTMRQVADALHGVPIDPEKRSALTLSIDGHIARARSAIVEIDRKLTVAMGTDAIRTH